MGVIISDVGAVFGYKKSGKFAFAAFMGKPFELGAESGAYAPLAAAI
jgi:hypothetical protein